MEIPEGELLGCKYGACRLPQPVFDKHVQHVVLNQLVNTISRIEGFTELRRSMQLPRMIGNLIVNTSRHLDWKAMVLQVMLRLFPDLDEPEKAAIADACLFLEQHKLVRVKFMKRVKYQLSGSKKRLKRAETP